MSSALQCLRHFTPIVKFLRRPDVRFKIKQQNSASARWLHAFDDLVNELDASERDGRGCDISPRPIYEAMRQAAPNTFRIAHRQEDALEVIHFFFEAIEQVARCSPDAVTEWRNLLGYNEIVHLRRSNGPSDCRVEPSSELRLSVPDQAQPIRLEPLLHPYFNEEPEERGESGWFHEQRRVGNAPEVLVVAFNRVNGMTRIQTPVEVPSWFDLRPYMEQDFGTPVMYDLVAAILHLGVGANSGHFVASVRFGNRWFIFDDNTVQPVKQTAALSPRQVWLAIFQKRQT